MKILLPVTWEVCGTVEVEADSINEAMDVFYETRDHQLIRIKGDEVEAYGRMEIYPSFTRLTLPGESHSLPVLEFRFEGIDDTPETSILVLLDTDISANTKEALEDSISSYIDGVSALDFERLIHDVLSAEDIGHWILKPTHTFHI